MIRTWYRVRHAGSKRRSIRLSLKKTLRVRTGANEHRVETPAQCTHNDLHSYIFATMPSLLPGYVHNAADCASWGRQEEHRREKVSLSPTGLLFFVRRSCHCGVRSVCGHAEVHFRTAVQHLSITLSGNINCCVDSDIKMKFSSYSRPAWLVFVLVPVSRPSVIPDIWPGGRRSRFFRRGGIAIRR